jgi:hypothetical protein
VLEAALHNITRLPISAASPVNPKRGKVTEQLAGHKDHENAPAHFEPALLPHGMGAGGAKRQESKGKHFRRPVLGGLAVRHDLHLIGHFQKFG